MRWLLAMLVFIAGCRSDETDRACLAICNFVVVRVTVDAPKAMAPNPKPSEKRRTK